VRKDQARDHPGWRPEDREPTRHPSEHPAGLVETCQLVMGFTELEFGNVWNTMPPHTHGRRSEIYMYFDAAPARVMQHHGPPVRTEDGVPGRRRAVFSPSWSMHSGVGTADYRFVWSMGGENLEFDDYGCADRGGPRLNGRR